MNNPYDVDKILNEITIKEEKFLKHIKDFNKTVSESARRSEKYPAMRSLILDCHLEMEKLCDGIIGMYYVNHFSNREENFEEVLLTKITFEAKKEILMTIIDIPNDILRFIEKLNSLRNAFAHGYDTKHDKFKYIGEKYIFEEDPWHKFILDYAKVMPHFVDCYKKILEDNTIAIKDYSNLANLVKELSVALMKSMKISKEDLQKFIDSRRSRNDKK